MPSQSPDMDAVESPLSRIQREISEVTERENEFRRTHSQVSTRKLSESDIDVDHSSTNGDENGGPHENGNPPKTLQRAYSTSYLTYTPPVIQHNGNTTINNNNNNITKSTTNGVSRRYVPNTQKGIMQRFIASKGQLNIAPLNRTASVPSPPIVPLTRQPFFNPITPPSVVDPAMIAKSPDGKPIRKGFVPVEEKIQKELKDIKDREMELKRQRKQTTSSYQLDLSSMDDSDKDEDYESDECDSISPEPGKLRATKSIGELYESLGDVSNASPTNAPGSESYGSLKPAKSLAELCDLGPGEEALAPSSTKLIAKWESLIQQRQESGAS